jgi:integrase
MFVRNVDGTPIQRWCDNLTGKRGLTENTAVRHFNVMHHLMKMASTIWSRETGLIQNPAGMIEIKRSDEIAVRARLKKGKVRYVPMPSELASEMKSYPITIGEDRIFPPTRGENKSGRQRLEGSFDDLLERARIREFRFHDLRHTFASWYMMNGGDLYELAKILGHANIKMTERYAKLGRAHIAKTGATAKAIWARSEAPICKRKSD